MMSGIAASLERFQARREGKRAGKRFAQFLEQTPWAQRRFRMSMMRVGPPVLKGKQLARVSKSCYPANLIVQPKGRKYEDGLCNCGQHSFKAAPGLPGYAATLSHIHWIADEFKRRIAVGHRHIVTERTITEQRPYLVPVAELDYYGYTKQTDPEYLVVKGGPFEGYTDMVNEPGLDLVGF